MLIRIGFEIIVECTAPMPFLLALLPHSSYGGRVIGSDRIRTEPEVPLEEYLDPFGNRRTRIVARVGCLKLWSDCFVEDEGVPDPFNWDARQHEICLLYTSPSPRDGLLSRMPSSA